MFVSSQMRRFASDSIESPTEGKVRSLNSELWHACAGPLVSLPMVGSRVVYLPQGHSEQVAASTQKEVDARIPNYPNLPPQLICQLHNVTLHADIETDEVYCQMTLQPVNAQEKESVLVPDLGSQNRQPNNFFCKTLTASDTSTHGGFSIPRRAAEKVFPPLDFSQTPPAQELLVKDLHDIEWKFRHIYRGQPKRHLLTTGWSVFVSAKRLTAGDSVLFIRNEKGQLLLGIRRATRPQTVMPSSVLSSDSMHIGILAAAAHAASTNSRFTVFYNPRASPSEFVIPFMKYEKAVCHTRVSMGMRFRMLFETEESSVRRYMGTITGIGDIDALRWPNSQWRSIKVGWDESTAGERQKRVSIWEIEPLTTFLLYPQLSNWRLRCPWPQPFGVPLPSGSVEVEGAKKPPVWLGNHPGDNGFHALVTQGTGMNSWGHLQHRYDSNMDSDVYAALGAAALEEITPSKQLHNQQQSTQSEQALYKPESQLHHHPHYQLQQQQQLQPSLVQSPSVQVLQQRPLPAQQQKPNGLVLQQSEQLGPLVQQQAHQHAHPQPHYSFSQQQTHVAHLDQSHQHQSIQLPNADGAITRLLSSQPQVTLNSTLSVPQSTVTEFTPMPISTASSLNTLSLQSILASSTTEVNALQSAMVPVAQPVRQQQSGMMLGSELHQETVSTSWFPASHVSGGQLLTGLQPELIDIGRPIAGAYVPPQTDPTSLPMPKISAPALPPTIFGFGDRPQEQDALQSDLHSQTLFGVNVDPPFTMPTSMWASSRSFIGDNEFQNPCVSQLMQGKSSVVAMDMPLNTGLFNGGLDDNNLLQDIHALSQANPSAVKTYTKVYKHGSVGRSVDVTRFKNYEELRHELASLFGLESQLEDPRSGWQLIFIDKEDDWLLLGDDPWEAFVSNVRYIKILCPSEIIEMQEGMGLQTGFPHIQRQTSSSSEDGSTQLDSGNPSSVLTSTCSLEY